MMTIDHTLDEIMKLDFQSREILLKLLQHRQADARRDEIFNLANSSIEEYHAGVYTAMSAEDAIKKLHSI